MKTRRKLNYEVLALIGGVWLVVGMVAFLVVALSTRRHSEATRIVGLVWFLPLALGVFGLLWTTLPEVFGVRPRLGGLWRRVREPVTDDLRSQK